VYFDSCIVIYLIERRAPWHSGIRQQLRRLSTPIAAIRGDRGLPSPSVPELPVTASAPTLCFM
jgi:hypothetical protein